MHELSIAVNIAELAQAELEKLGCPQVRAIHLKLGKMSGVVKEALEFSFEIACQDTPLQGAQLVIEEVPVLIDCRRCQAPREIVSLQSFRCIECGTPSSTIRQGREIMVSALEVVDEPEEHLSQVIMKRGD